MDTFFLKIKIRICKLISRPLFIIKIENGITSKVSGSIKSGFINDCDEISKMNGLQFGIIYGVTGQFGKLSIKVSSNISNDVLQQFRNAWGFS